MVKITIGVPVYNAEKWIGTALESFIQQTMNKDEFEVICVDDCSTDNSLEVIGAYTDRLNLKVIQLPQNSGGPGGPRNKVIDEANGEYIFFVDADDYIHHEALDKMYHFAKENHSDVLLVKMQGVNGRGVPMSMFQSTEGNVDLYESRLIYTLSPQKLFRTSLLVENNIRFPEHVKSAEDQLFTMKAYLKSNILSVLADQAYYFLTFHDGEHMSGAYVSPKDFYEIMSNIMDEIFATSESEERKNKLGALFINRHFHFSRTNNFSIKIKDTKQKIAWMKELSKFIINHVPVSVDELVDIDIQPRLNFARKEDYDRYEKYEKALKTNEFDVKIEHDEIYASFKVLQDYPRMSKLNFTHFNKIKHKLTNIHFGEDRLTVTATIRHSIFSELLNEQQQVVAVFVNRGNKQEKHVYPIMAKPKSQEYTFEIPFEGLITSPSDIGIWDMFIESSVDSYKLRARVGNNRETYRYKAETSFIGEVHSIHYRLTPYFTKPYDNFSIYSKKLEGFEKKLKLIHEKHRLIIEYPTNHLLLPQHSMVSFELKNQSYTFGESQIIWDNQGTKFIVESLFLPKPGLFSGIHNLKVNGLLVKK